MGENNNSKSKKNTKKSLKGGETETVVVSDKSKFAHIEPVQAKPLEVKVYGNAFEKALRAFRALVQKERILSAYKEKQVYEKPSDRNRRKKNEARRKSTDLSVDKEPKQPKKAFKKKNTDHSVD